MNKHRFFLFNPIRSDKLLNNLTQNRSLYKNDWKIKAGRAQIGLFQRCASKIWVTSDLKKLDPFTLETSKNHLIRNFLRNERVRVKTWISPNVAKISFLQILHVLSLKRGNWKAANSSILRWESLLKSVASNFSTIILWPSPYQSSTSLICLLNSSREI